MDFKITIITGIFDNLAALFDSYPGQDCVKPLKNTRKKRITNIFARIYNYFPPLTMVLFRNRKV